MDIGFLRSVVPDFDIVFAKTVCLQRPERSVPRSPQLRWM